MIGHSDDEQEVKDFLLKQKGHTFVDIGANTGFYTINLASSFKRVVAFEPFPLSADVIRKQVIESGLTNVEVYDVALSNKRGRIEFYLSPRGHKCHSLLPVGNKTINVEVSTLADELPYAKIDLVKIDTEGNEFEVLEGTRGIIHNINTFIIEVHDLKEICGNFAEVRGSFEERCKEMESLLKEYGYKTKWITVNNVIYAWREEG